MKSHAKKRKRRKKKRKKEEKEKEEKEREEKEEKKKVVPPPELARGEKIVLDLLGLGARSTVAWWRRRGFRRPGGARVFFLSGLLGWEYGARGVAVSSWVRGVEGGDDERRPAAA